LVESCDKYRDLWRPFFSLFWRYWPDCPFPVFLGTNAERFDDPRVTTLNTPAQTWSSELRAHLQDIEHPYVLLLLEDFFLCERVISERVRHSLLTLYDLGGTTLRLYPLPGPDEPLPGDPGIGRIHPKAEYRVSAQPAIWNRARLLDLLDDRDSAWQFETEGTRRSRSQSDGFFAVYEPALRYRHVVERGKWFRSAAKFYEREQIGCDFGKRPVIGALETVKKAAGRRVRNLRSALIRMRYRGRP
jgi:hypothetical protein